MDDRVSEESASHHRRLESMYNAAPINTFITSRLSVGDGSAEIVLDVRDNFHHAFGAVHGSIYFKLLDDAAYFAANSVVTDRCLVTVTFSVQFMRPVSTGQMRAEGHLIHNAGRLFVAESQVVNEGGDLVAVGHGTFARSSARLTDASGYRQD